MREPQIGIKQLSNLGPADRFPLCVHLDHCISIGKFNILDGIKGSWATPTGEDIKDRRSSDMLSLLSYLE